MSLARLVSVPLLAAVVVVPQLAHAVIHHVTTTGCPTNLARRRVLDERSRLGPQWKWSRDLFDRVSGARRAVQ
jgi:hypothetical protein